MPLRGAGRMRKEDVREAVRNASVLVSRKFQVFIRTYEPFKTTSYGEKII
jgi:hypothetical protein